MNIQFINLDQLKTSPLNVRKKGGKDVGDLTASIRSLGLLQPLLVRRDGNGFAVIAGQRRLLALSALADESGPAPVPCIVMMEGDDATAIEASLAENLARLPMDEIDQFKAFAVLHREGLAVDEIAAKFGVTERLVAQRLAIAAIIPPILNAYRREEIRPETLRLLTMATPRQQKAWWTLHQDKHNYAPTGRALKDWLLGGAQIPVGNALFDASASGAVIVSDLFGEERYFADAGVFWPLQNMAIAQARDAYLASGWREVVLLDVGKFFAEWDHVKTAKKNGGAVVVAVACDGEVTFHEGWLSAKDARRMTKGNVSPEGASAAATSSRPELTNAMQNYLGLHRHAAVRTELLSRPDIALRLAVAHLIAGSPLWRVRADAQKAASEAIQGSLTGSKAQAAFGQERAAIRTLLGIETDVDGADEDGSIEGAFIERGSIVPRPSDFGATRSLPELFARLSGMDDAAVLRVLTFVMAETLDAQSSTVEHLGALLGVDMRTWWSPDGTFFELLRDKEAINAALREVAGDITADEHLSATVRLQKKIIGDCLTGQGRPKVDGWLPRYMEFPASGYTARFGNVEAFDDEK